MPNASKWGIRLALLHLLVGSSLGLLVMLAKAGWLSGDYWSTLAPHFAVMMFGWMTQFAISVAFWMLPRLQGGRRGREPLFHAALVGLNLGVLLLAFEAAAGHLTIAVALTCFLVHAYPRTTRLSPLELRQLQESQGRH